eukprot:scaffold657177_cov59-Prasinocladus_malaysianus.AAC.1
MNSAEIQSQNTPSKSVQRRHGPREQLERSGSIGKHTGKPETLLKFLSLWFARLFPVWTLLGAGLGLYRQKAFAFMTVNAFTICLAVLMLSMGITLTVGDFKRVLQRPGP